MLNQLLCADDLVLMSESVSICCTKNSMYHDSKAYTCISWIQSTRLLLLPLRQFISSFLEAVCRSGDVLLCCASS